MKKAIVIGATSGIGKAVARILAANGYVVGLTGRRTELLETLHRQIPQETFVRRMDVAKPEEAVQELRTLIDEMGGMDLIILNAGVRFENQQLRYDVQQTTIDVNVSGFVALATFASHYFTEQRSGHIVGVSSIAAIRGRKDAPAYHASKAFVVNYLEGLRHRFSKMGIPVTVTDIRPGLVDTAIISGKNYSWVASPETAARQIYAAIKKRKNWTFVTKRWHLAAWCFKALPEWLYNKT